MTMHPLPQFERRDWRSLDGEWAFAFDDANEGLTSGWATGLPVTQPITVPFTYETEASGIGDPRHHETVWYQRTLELTATQLERHVYLNFGGVDHTATVFLNGQFIGRHVGGYTHFTLDITDFAVPGVNQLVVRVTDSKSVEQPRGKQRWRNENFECWYEQSTGIWKPVWLEFTAASHLVSLKLTPDRAQHTLSVLARTANTPDNATVTVAVSYAGEPVTTVQGLVQDGQAQLLAPILKAGEPVGWGIHDWRPDDPALYDLTVTLSLAGQTQDTVTSYFGMRQIEIRGNQILLNGSPLYQRLVLDQNYWPNSGLTPQDEAQMQRDIELILALGYNGVRLHMTVADQRFLALADRAGLLVWSEMPATFTFSDTAAAAFTREWLDVVEQNYNHPSIITWVPFNESWGVPDIQHDTRQQALTQGIYHLTKAIDPYRPVVTNDGWEHTCSDILTLHDYEPDGEAFTARYHDLGQVLAAGVPLNGSRQPFADGFAYQGQPVIISEFGGIAFADDSGWGYGDQVTGQESFLARFDKIHAAIQQIPGIVGYCYTQLTDVAQEVNGVLTIDRQPKLPIEALHAVNTRRR